MTAEDVKRRTSITTATFASRRAGVRETLRSRGGGGGGVQGFGRREEWREG
jgi:hypothetical protein